MNKRLNWPSVLLNWNAIFEDTPNEIKIKARGLKRGCYYPDIDPHFKKRTQEEIAEYEKGEKKTLRHYKISNSNAIALAKTEKEIDEVLKYAKRHPNALITTVIKKFSNIKWHSSFQ